MFFTPLLAIAQNDFPVAQKDTAEQQLKFNYNNRKWLAAGSSIAAYGGSVFFLNEAWYKDYPRRSFHTFNDSGEWMQMDKMGHAWTAYHASRLSTNLWRWAGVNKNNSVLLGTGSSLLYLFTIEYLDGRSAQWGWSWADGGTNLFGALLFAGQELGWEKQKISLKFSTHFKSYDDAILEARSKSLFGKNLPQRILKDYNAQTYWLSANIKSFLPKSKLPEWLNIAVGYGAEGMFGGYENVATDKNGAIIFDRKDIPRYRQWYLSPDIDFTKIKTKSAFLKSLFSVANVLKIPAPALQFSQGKFGLRALVF